MNSRGLLLRKVPPIKIPLQPRIIRGFFTMANEHIRVRFPVSDPALQQILIAELSAAGFEGFEEQEQVLDAFIQAAELDKGLLEDISSRHAVSFSTEEIVPQNWNALWEANFPPVIVDDFAAVRASFHEPVTGVELEILITPKMSFGTGHHATTWMMMRRMRSLDLQGKVVTDYGTGTGVLAILAEKRGAKEVLAIDNDDWSIENALENCERNACRHIQVHKGDRIPEGVVADVVLANINKNVILDQLPVMKRALRPGGILLLSGLLREDEGEVRDACTINDLQFLDMQERNNWICLAFQG